MPLYRDDTTNVVTDYPIEVGEHPVLGAHLSLYTPVDDFDPEDPPAEEFEEDKVVVEGAHSTQRVQRTATPKSKD